MVRSVDRSPFWIAVSKFWIVVRTMSSCDTAAASSRVSSTVPRMATAASAAITRTSAMTQPQLRRLRGGFGWSPRPGITCGAAEPAAGSVR